MATNNASNNTDSMAANSIRGNNTGAVALGVDLTVTQLKALTNTAPAVTVYQTGSGTYSTPAGALYLMVEMWGSGGGSGGSSSDTSATSGGNGNASTFGGGLTANGGALGARSVSGVGGAGGAGGTATGGDVNYTGTIGQTGSNFVGTAYQPAAVGGHAVLSPGAATVMNTNGVITAGTAPIANSGSGGSGTNANISTIGGSGGGGGAGSLRKLITSPSASYAYAVGAAGAAGASGTGGANGVAGAVGQIVVTAYFQ